MKAADIAKSDVPTNSGQTGVKEYSIIGRVEEQISEYGSMPKTGIYRYKPPKRWAVSLLSTMRPYTITDTVVELTISSQLE